RILHPEPRKNLALVPNEHHSLGGELLVVFFQFGWSRRPQTAFVPDQVQRPPVSPCRILETHHTGRWEREIILDSRSDTVRQYLIVARCRFDAGGPGQVQRTEHSPQTVVPH